MRRVVLVLDLGSSRMRCVAVGLDDRPPSAEELASAPYPLAPSRGGDLARAYDPRLLRRRMLATLAAAAHAVGPRNVERVAVTAQRGGVCFLDRRLRPVYVGPQTDLRAVFQGAALDEAHGARIHAVTGHLPSMLFAPAKLAWMRQERPRLAERIAYACGLDAWACLALTGTLADTREGLAELGLLDVTPREPATALLAAIGAPDVAPPLVALGEGPACGLRPDVAEATGLATRVQARLAGPDAQVAAVGAGAVQSGDASVAAGWSAPSQVATPSPAFDAARRTWTTLHAADGLWVAEANAGDAGRAVDAARRLLRPRTSPAQFDALAASADSAPSVAAFLGPRALDMAQPGMTMGGLLLPAPITQAEPGAGAVARAVYENVAFAVGESLRLAQDVARPTLGAGREGVVALSGGMAQGSLLPQMLADLLRRPVRVQPLATALGAALIAATDAGELAARAAEAAASAPEVEPGPDAAETGARSERWLRLRERLDAASEEL